MDTVKILDRYSAGDEFQRPVESAIEEITTLRQRVAELEEMYELSADVASTTLARNAELTSERDALKQQRDVFLAALVDIQQVACSGSPELGIASDAIASVKEK